MPRQRLLLLLLLGWALGTLALATGLGSSVRTQQLLLPWLRDLGLDELWALRVHKGLRKLGHVAAYAGFAALLAWALAGVRHRAAWVLLAAAVLAVADETVQSFFSSRGASGLDVLLDLLAVGAVLAVLRRRERAPAPRP